MNRSRCLALIALLFAACGEDGVPGNTPDAVARDLSGVDAYTGAAQGTACAADDECASGSCVLLPDGSAVCAGVDCGACGAGWSCAEKRCIPNAFWACAPCQSDAECGGGTRCIASGDAGERFCLNAGCSLLPGAAADCSAGTTCQQFGAETACAPADGLCPCTEAHEGRVTVCGAEDGCAGTRTCSSGVLGECTAPKERGPEVCDGLDNDCNGLVDDGLADVACDDGVSCTTDDCVAGQCVFGVAPGRCLIGPTCWEAGVLNPQAPCERCDPALASEAWSPRDGACDDGDACTVGDACAAGACVSGAAGPCDDGLECTADACSCDGDCTEASCSHAPLAGRCVIDGVCYTEGDINPADPCSVCAPLTTATGWSPAVGEACDDDDPCTDLDQCDAQGQCQGQARVCDDGIPCTVEACSGGACEVVGTVDNACFIDGVCWPIASSPPNQPCLLCNGATAPLTWSPREDGESCGAKCEVAGTCAAGECTGTTRICECFDDLDCDDGNLCNGVPECVKDGAITSWHCEAGAVEPVVCADGDPSDCTLDLCDPATGSCVSTHVPDGTGCTDGDGCTAGDACASGTCVGAAVKCDDGNPCTVDACGASGCTSVPTSMACDDGDACTVGDTCAAGVCTPAQNVCGCTSDASCPVLADKCQGHYECVSGGTVSSCQLVPATPCNTSGDGPCVSTVCVPASGDCVKVVAKAGSACDDGNVCTPSSVCSGETCSGVGALSCDDGNACTADTCKPKSGCESTPTSGGPCEDGDLCTLSDVCASGQCVPSGQKCACAADSDCPFLSGSACNGAPHCNTSGPPSSWACTYGAPVVCPATGNVCEQAVCDPKTGLCDKVATQSLCNDGNACTKLDACVGGACQGQPVVCDDALACTADACAPATGCTYTLAAGSCLIDGRCVAKGEPNPANPCQICTPSSSTTAWSPALGTPCDDGIACTHTDVCTAGVCAGTDYAALCNDNLPCTQDTCNGQGGCSHPQVQKTCLVGGQCADAGDHNPKNVCEVCTPQLSSTDWSAAGGGPCDDGEPCTVGDTCSGRTCVGPVPLLCSDGNACTKDVCTPGKGCEFLPTTGPCDDGDSCTHDDKCAGGVCAGTNTCQCVTASDCAPASPCFQPATCQAGQCVYAPVVCSPSTVTCLVNTCNPSTGQCAPVPVTNGTTCDDGDVCSTASSCKSGLCTASANLVCNDFNLCTTDSCSPSSGCRFENNTLQQACYTGAAGTQGVGPCKAGLKTCSGGVFGSCQGEVVPGAELCDGLDNDCDALTDEVFPVGQACDGPDADLCKTGTFVCATNGAGVVCAEPGVGSVEVCDGLDNDCDLQTDEGCDDDQDGYCDSAMTVVNNSACAKGPGDCRDDLPKVNPGMFDLPDLSTQDVNCDGLDGQLTDAIFVSRSCGDDDLEGTSPKTAVATLVVALQRADKYARHQIIVDHTAYSGAYTTPITLVSGVGLYGGYRGSGADGLCSDTPWARSFTNITTLSVTGASSANQDVKAVEATELTSPATLQGLKIQAGFGDLSWRTGRSVYGVFIRGGNVTLEGSTVVADVAASGRDGSNGAKGSDGSAGGAGSKDSSSGGGGAAPSCVTSAGVNRVGYAGGAGGAGGVLSGNRGTDGYPQSSVARGKGGDGGNAMSCLVSGIDPNGKFGTNATPATGAAVGANASSGAGTEAIKGWQGIAGSAGTDGEPGAGGGGGGGGAGITGLKEGIQPGSGGGGGGAGGCGGLSGEGGQAGGGSFGVYVTVQGGVSTVGPVRITQCVINAGRGGAGGKGANGGEGGKGGEGGEGGPEAAYTASCSLTGDDGARKSGSGGGGGRGARGQGGGGGGGGAGGVSYALYWGSGVNTPEVATSTLTAAGGGAGGTQSASGAAAPTGASAATNKPLQ